MENVNRPWSDETGLGKGNSTPEGFGLGRFHPLPPTFPAPIVLDPPDREPVEGHLVRGNRDIWSGDRASPPSLPTLRAGGGAEGGAAGSPRGAPLSTLGAGGLARASPRGGSPAGSPLSEP